MEDKVGQNKESIQSWEEWECCECHVGETAALQGVIPSSFADQFLAR